MSKLKRTIKRELGHKSMNDLSTDGLVLFNLLVLITDIKYRLRYGQALALSDDQSYSKNMKNENFPEQTSPVESLLERASQQGGFDAA